MVAFFPLSSQAINSTANDESYLQGKIPTCLFKGLWKTSWERGRTERDLPAVGTGQRQLPSALKLQEKTSRPFPLQQANWDTRQRQLTRGQQPACTPPICPHRYLMVLCIINTVSLTNGQSSMCQTPSSPQVIKRRTWDSGGNTWDWQ